MSLYTLIEVPDDEAITQANLEGLTLCWFNTYTKILIPALVAITLLINVLIDYLGFD
jgi:hypothetical protein